MIAECKEKFRLPGADPPFCVKIGTCLCSHGAAAEKTGEENIPAVRRQSGKAEDYRERTHECLDPAGGGENGRQYHKRKKRRDDGGIPQKKSGHSPFCYEIRVKDHKDQAEQDQKSSFYHKHSFLQNFFRIHGRIRILRKKALPAYCNLPADAAELFLLFSLYFPRNFDMINIVRFSV